MSIFLISIGTTLTLSGIYNFVLDNFVLYNFGKKGKKGDPQGGNFNFYNGQKWFI